MFGGNPATSLGASLIISGLATDEEKKLLINKLQHDVEFYSDARIDEIAGLILTSLQSKLQTKEDFAACMTEDGVQLPMDSIDPLNEALYNNLATIAEQFVTQYGGALTEEQQAVELGIVFNFVLLNALNDITHAIQKKLNTTARLLMMYNDVSAAVDGCSHEHTGNNMASAEGVQDQQQATEAPTAYAAEPDGADIFAGVTGSEADIPSGD